MPEVYHRPVLDFILFATLVRNNGIRSMLPCRITPMADFRSTRASGTLEADLPIAMIQAPKASCEARASLRASLAKYPLAGGERSKGLPL